MLATGAGIASLLLGLLWLALAVLGVVPPWRPARLLWDGVAVFGSELAWPLIAVGPVLWGITAAAGALQRRPGLLGTLAMALAVALLALSLQRAVQDGERLRRELARLPGAPAPAAVHFGDWARPLHFPLDGIHTTAGIAYGPDPAHRLDLLRADPAPAGGRMPVLLHLHGGGLISGVRNLEAMPLMHAMARRGWLVATADYRLAPGAKWPAQIQDAKRVVAWLRAHAAEHGGDPSFIAITGGSAGGSLAALLALSPGEAAWQPGFEQADTRVQAVVPFYGSYDFDGEGLGHLEKFVMPASREADPALWHAAWAVHRVAATAPPFFVIHGDHDALATVVTTRVFAERLRAVSQAPVLYGELHGAVHGHDAVNSLRTRLVVEAVDTFLQHTLAQQRRAPPAPGSPP